MRASAPTRSEVPLGFAPVENPRVCVALVKFDKTEDETETCVQNLLARTSEEGVSITQMKVTGCNVHMGREKVVMMRRHDHTHILFVDDDVTFPEDGLLRLLKHGLPVVGGVYTKNREPFIPNVMLRVPGSEWDFDQIATWDALEKARNHEVSQVMLCDAIATGFLLIDIRVFEHIEQPWFWYRYCDSSASIYDYWSSDTDFCIKVRDAGYGVYADAGLECGHIGYFTYQMEHFRMQREKYEHSAARSVYQKAFHSALIESTGDPNVNLNTPKYWDGMWKIWGDSRKRPDLYDPIVTAIDESDIVVDLGCGVGVFADYLAETGSCKEIICVDHAPVAIQACEDKGYRSYEVDLSNPVGHLEYLYGDVDVVVATEVLEHMDEPDVLVEFALKLLKPDGVLFLSVPDGCMSPVSEPEHRKIWSALELKTFLQDHFSYVEVQKIQNYALAAVTNRSMSDGVDTGDGADDAEHAEQGARLATVG